ncbi:MAG: hypothetical protein AB2421_21080 [Thermotaleaceae bacterium]
MIRRIIFDEIKTSLAELGYLRDTYIAYDFANVLVGVITKAA